jgi:SPP1 family predicted phage head-tail adaptor
MRAGDLRHRITIQSVADTQNSYGEGIPSYTDLITVWAQISPLSGKELDLTNSKTLTAIASHKIIIRYNPNINITNRIKWGTDQLGFDNLDDDQFQQLDNDEFMNLGDTSSTGTRYFAINNILNKDYRNIMQTLLVTELLK